MSGTDLCFVLCIKKYIYIYIFVLALCCQKGICFIIISSKKLKVILLSKFSLLDIHINYDFDYFISCMPTTTHTYVYMSACVYVILQSKFSEFSLIHLIIAIGLYKQGINKSKIANGSAP